LSIFYSNYVRLCAKKQKSPSAVAEEIGLSRTSPNGWKKGKQPSDVTLEKLSQYFEVSVSELTEAQDTQTSTDGAELRRGREEMHERLDRLSDEEYEALKPALSRLFGGK
jgi:transcriptional regulator with XRE-family HTH domain